ncbi:MAG: hypothetical protein IJX01_05905 [Oscillospiraceae bacterium]|nr:hypothetical protein [Oscillospiraceae bacterium]
MKTPNVDYYTASQDFAPKKATWRHICGLAFKELRPNKKDWLGVVLPYVGGIIFAWIIGSAEDTVQMTDTICTVFLEIHIAVFGCILAAYSILLAFLDDKYIKKLLRINYEGNANYLKAGTEYFETAMYIYVVGILLSLIVKLIVICMPNDYVLTCNDLLNESLAATLLFGYLAYTIRATYEIKSVVANTATLFGGSLAFRIQAFASDINDEN